MKALADALKKQQEVLEKILDKLVTIGKNVKKGNKRIKDLLKN